ncbi:MAG TPA: hypothetical protein VKV28_02100 [Candidatus Binataceae bacterium]|nr:hypothetical protein [Candidatus Binataceae bacterium]
MTTMANAEALDAYMYQLVRALHGAVRSALPHVNDDPQLVDRTLQDCGEILDVILKGDVAQWLADED